ncbi:unnamed protein product [Brassica rapa subsp. trilocularis]
MRKKITMSSMKFAIFCIVLVSFVSVHECFSLKGLFTSKVSPCEQIKSGSWCCFKGIPVCQEDKRGCEKMCVDKP